jgi:endonuclease-8
MRMQGQWHVYRPGQRWWFAPSKARVVIRTDEYVAPCETPPVVELMTAREVALHPVIPELGPDVIADDFDLDEGVRRLREQPERDIATAFLDQRTLSGIGNEIKNETLFITRTWPWTKIGELDDDELRRVVLAARDLLRRNRDGGPRRSRFTLDRRQLRSVQERRGMPCYECGTPIDVGFHPNEFRKSYYCPPVRRRHGRPRPALFTELP